MRAQQILIARLNEVLEPMGLTFPRYEALMLLHFSSRGSLPLGKIGERLQVHRTSITNTIDGLESLGLVRRVPHDSDRRTTLAEILPRGREVAERATEALHDADFSTPPLDTAQLETLFDTLRTLRHGAGDFD
jgi:DNA-binding MarR family transcriptional regulator